MSDAVSFWNRLTQLDIDSMNDAERLCFIVSMFVADFENGGFDQFFYNFEAVEIKDVEDGLRTIGAFRAVDIFLQAKALLSSGDDAALDMAGQRLQKNPDFDEFDRLFSTDEVNDVFNRLEAYAASQGLWETPPN